MMMFAPSQWRLLHTPPAPGAWNMAVDEAILEAIGRGESLPTLRCYAWQPPCLSLGFAQPVSDVDLERLRQRGWDLVRRPTGGRAILHTDELTYSVTGPQDEPRLAGGVLESYHNLSQALLAALQRLGLPAEASPLPGLADGADPKGAVCFEVPSNYEITAGGKKLLGSAQRRQRDGVLQHGTLPLHGDLSRITQALAFSHEAARQTAAERLRSRAATAEEIIGRRLSWEAAASAFATAFSSVLNLKLIPDELTPAERLRAAELVQAKYASDSWNFRT